MFCTTTLSAPEADEPGCEGGGGRSFPPAAGGGVMHGRALGGPLGDCLSTLHCLVLPQEEMYQSLSYRHGDGNRGGGGGGGVGKRMLLQVNRATSCGEEDGGVGGGGGGGGGGTRRHRSRSVSPALGRRPRSPAMDWFKGIVARGMWTPSHPTETFCRVTPR